MRRIYTFIILILIAVNTYSQTAKPNTATIDKVKTNAGKAFIEENIIGYWKFEKLTTPEGEEINTQTITLGNSVQTRIKPNRPSLEFKKSKSARIFNLDESVDEGKWKYNEKEKVLVFIYNETQYSPPPDKMSPELLKKAKEQGLVVEYSETGWEIHKITNDTLIIISHLPHNEHEFKYNLAVYKKVE
ncbi:hypothetical protein GCM10007424_24770 [Flavobacterium suaedae]|uniref:Lipocalin-like domain-containing protein n=1 Tax=Flavobacterium suaedae TaxID=1767027 RepID=A0ABQ1K4I1_9FLAO|nr:hypothetical protein [Flavobacterium suaedae]GGB83792.1 hypothetical protein GCM10007424_24770 [Flavobacterium suaedae]